MSYGKIPHNVLSTAERCIQHLIIYSRLYSTFHTTQQIFRKHLWHCIKSDVLHI